MRRRLALLPAIAMIAACGEALPLPQPRAERAASVAHAMCQLGFASAPIEKLRTGHQAVDVVLNGQPGFFILDTGANASAVHAGAAEQFELGRLPVGGSAVGLGGAMPARLSLVREFRIGDVPTGQRTIAVADLAQLLSFLGAKSERPILGIVGQDVLTRRNAVIDVAGGRLYLLVERRGRDDPPPVCEAVAGEDAPA